MICRTNKTVIAILLFVAPWLTTSVHAQWYASADFMLPTREIGSDVVLQRNQVPVTFDNPATTPVETTIIGYAVGTEALLTADDLDFGHDVSGRFTVGRKFQVFGLEASYTSPQELCAAASLYNNGTLTQVGGVTTTVSGTASPIGLPGTAVNPQFDNNNLVEVLYRTEMETAEAHLTQLVAETPTASATLLYGLRYFSIDEAFNYRSENNLGENIFFAETTNSMLGPQCGIRGEADLPGGLVSVSFKGALLANSIDISSTRFNGVFEGEESAAALLGEASIEYIWMPHPNFAWRIGFQGIGVTQTALAVDNLFSADPRCVNTNEVGYGIPYTGILIAF